MKFCINRRPGSSKKGIRDTQADVKNINENKQESGHKKDPFFENRVIDFYADISISPNIHRKHGFSRENIVLFTQLEKEIEEAYEKRRSYAKRPPDEGKSVPGF